jgi:SAM-dependent methyltransferase
MSMLLAEAVGDTGSVVAFDREPMAIEVAKARALAAGHRQIEFLVTSDETFPCRLAFDAAIGRYVLHHQSDPVAMIRRAAAAVRHGGIVAFHEPAGHIGGHTLPIVDLYVELERSLSSVFDTLPHRDIGGRLIACFEDAGLPTPRLIWESITGGHESPLWRLMAMTYRSILPQIAGSPWLPREDVGDPATLADRLVAEARVVRAQIVSKPQSCAWVIRP